MTRPTLSIITPTFGRSTIIDAIGSVVPQLLPGDEYIIVGDGEVPIAGLIAKEFWSKGVRYMETPTFTGDFGCTPWDYAIGRAKGDYLMFLGDDNRLSVNALEIVRKGLLERPDLPHIFAMLHTGRVLCDSRDCGRVDNQQLVVPRLDIVNDQPFPKMREVEKKDLLISDWVFLDKVVKLFKGVVFHPDIIVVLDRQNFGAML